MTLAYLISALTIRTQHTKQERTTSGQEGQDKRPRPSVWLGQAHRASASREQPFRGTSAIVVRSSFDGASVAGAYRAHIDHAARADSDHAQRSRDELILGLLVGHAEAVAADSRAAHSPSAWYARAIANAAPPASAQRTRASGEPWSAQTRVQPKPLKALERKTGRLGGRSKIVEIAAENGRALRSAPVPPLLTCFTRSRTPGLTGPETQ